MRSFFIHALVLVFALFGTLFFSGCVPKEPAVTDQVANFEALWKIMDERYCYFGEKEVDWDAVHKTYLSKLKERKHSDIEFFDLMGQMLNELKDGHVNLISSFDISQYNGWRGDPTVGLNIYAREQELPGVRRYSGGMSYQKYGFEADPDLSFGYVRYGSFSSSLGDLSTMFGYMSDVDGLILDLRGNGGGALSNSTGLLSRFFKEKTLVGYLSHKTGTGHNDFSDLSPLYVTPYENQDKRWTDKPVIVLQDRSCYSATNDFLTKIDLAPNVTRIGLRSGGGGGIPASQELPNGWIVRYSSVRNYNVEKKSVESGIEPDIEISGVSYYEDPKAPDLILRGAIAHFFKMFHPGNNLPDKASK